MKTKGHECMDCRVLPIGVRPAVPRPIDKRSGPRSPRCWSHLEAKLAAERRRGREKRQSDVYGMTVADYAELKAFQGGFCPCGNAIRDSDHDHRLARQHEHEPKKACKRCMRGLLCASCNRFILGRGYTSARLRALADYYDDPPAQRLWGEESA